MEWWDGIAVVAAVVSLVGSFLTGWHLAEYKARRALRRHRQAAAIRQPSPIDKDVFDGADWVE
jgi:hypothetical protein